MARTKAGVNKKTRRFKDGKVPPLVDSPKKRTRRIEKSRVDKPSAAEDDR